MGCDGSIRRERTIPSSAFVVIQVVDILEAGGVVLSRGVVDFEEVVGELVDELVGSGQLRPELRSRALSAVVERESLSSTVMVEIGVSIPHARVDGVEGVLGALAVSPTGVYHAMAGVPIGIVVLVLSSPDLAGEHLNALAGLSLMLQSESLRGDLTSARDPEQVIAHLRKQSGRRGA